MVRQKSSVLRVAATTALARRILDDLDPAASGEESSGVHWPNGEQD